MTFKFCFKGLEFSKPREVYLSRIICPNDGLVDEVTVVFFPEPNSYSGENILKFMPMEID